MSTRAAKSNTNRFSTAKQQLCKCITFFGTLSCSDCTLRYFTFHEGHDHRTTIVSFFFLKYLGYSSYLFLLTSTPKIEGGGIIAIQVETMQFIFYAKSCYHHLCLCLIRELKSLKPPYLNLIELHKNENLQC